MNDTDRQILLRTIRRDAHLAEIAEELSRILNRVNELQRIKEAYAEEIERDKALIERGYGHGV